MAKYYKGDFSVRQNLTDPAEDVAKIFPQEGPILDYGEDLGSPSTGVEYMPRCLLCSEDMTVTMVCVSGVKRTNVPLMKGYNPIGALEIHTISSGTIWGIK
jgi:hypothetical protein